MRLSLARQLPVALATVPKNYNSNKYFASALDLNLRALFLFCALSINRRHMTKITLALSFLLLGSLACMQSAPSSPTNPPTTQPKQTLISEPGIVCTVNTHALNVRDCGGFDCSIVGWLEDGWTVQAQPGSMPGSSWIYITRGNLSGFARADYLTCNSGE